MSERERERGESRPRREKRKSPQLSLNAPLCTPPPRRSQERKCARTRVVSVSEARERRDKEAAVEKKKKTTLSKSHDAKARKRRVFFFMRRLDSFCCCFSRGSPVSPSRSFSLHASTKPRGRRLPRPRAERGRGEALFHPKLANASCCCSFGSRPLDNRHRSMLFNCRLVSPPRLAPTLPLSCHSKATHLELLDGHGAAVHLLGLDLGRGRDVLLLERDCCRHFA